MKSVNNSDARVEIVRALHARSIKWKTHQPNAVSAGSHGPTKYQHECEKEEVERKSRETKQTDKKGKEGQDITDMIPETPEKSEKPPTPKNPEKFLLRELRHLCLLVVVPIVTSQTKVHIEAKGGTILRFSNVSTIDHQHNQCVRK